ncbi:MAG: hypothetical protein NDJ89_04325 [Oligoflexia bacterium]|nr:hypothetical protein [Oligoflexia bacterium]
MLCELSRQVSQGGEKAIRDTWNAALAPGAVGGAYAGGALVLAQGLPTVGPAINAVVGVGLLAKMGYDMGLMFGMRSKSSDDRERTLGEVAGRVKQGELPVGALIDLRRQADQGQARDRAELWGDVVMIGSMVPHAKMFLGRRGMAEHGAG